MLMFTALLLSSTLISISASSWLIAWLGLEINLLSFIPLMKKMNKFTSEAMIKYFIVQALASMVLIMSMMLSMSNTEMPTYSPYSLMMSSSLLLKMGAAPLHYWFPEVMSGLEWPVALLLSTWQKITPSVLLSLSHPETILITLTAIMSIMIGSLQSMGQTCMRKLMAYSSINNIGWMIPLIFMNTNTWMLYLIIYSTISASIILTLKKTKIFYLSQMNKLMHSNKAMKIFFSMSFLSLSGLPPFLGFMPKWMTIQTMILEKMTTTVMVMVIFTLLMVFVYTRIIMTSLAISSTESLKINNNHMSKLIFISVYGLPISTMMF
uniref:NADH-ubiquinone oxidoreductase chain 2 n=1 Tax=Scolytinae sp. BMNH 1040327 TaxID=1903790 RepID=A0A343A641_9CUCU|nr:NADH dehydrogenase subunit 2 [Scolytinae sp. BMNH 1040327]